MRLVVGEAVPALPIRIHLLDQRAASSLTPSRSRPQRHRSTGPSHEVRLHRSAPPYRLVAACAGDGTAQLPPQSIYRRPSHAVGKPVIARSSGAAGRSHPFDKIATVVVSIPVSLIAKDYVHGKVPCRAHKREGGVSFSIEMNNSAKCVSF